MEVDGALVHQLDHWRVEAYDYVLGYFEDNACPPGRHAPPLSRRIPVPGPAHTQMRVQRQAVVEADQHVLAARFDIRDAAADNTRDLRTGSARASRQNGL